MQDKILEMNDVRIVFRNFEGRQGKFNREGDRNFAVVIEDPDVAEEMLRDGWNVKTKPPREEGDDPFQYLSVKVKYNEKNPRSDPRMYLVTGKKRNLLTVDSVSVLDNIDIQTADIDIRAYEYDVNGKTGIAAYLVGGRIVQNVSRFEARFADEDEED